MACVAQHELERVLAGRKFYSRFRLARSKMKMRFVLRNRFLGIDRLIHINQQMMMAAVLVIIAGMRNAHVAQTETTPERSFDRRAILRPDEIQNGILWRWFAMDGNPLAISPDQVP